MSVPLQTAALALGGLGLLGEVDPVHGGRIQALGNDFSLGDPEAVIALLQSQWQDGDWERIDRYGNRSASMKLRIDAPDSAVPGDAIAHSQAALDRVCPRDGAWTTLVWTSPLAGAETTVFEVTTATVSVEFDDLRELQAGCRYVTLTIHARPFVRPVAPVTIPAQAVVGTTTTTVDSGSSTTGWSMLSTAPAVTKNLETNPSSTGLNGWTAGAGSSSLSNSFSYMNVATTAVAGTRVYVNSPAYTVVAGRAYEFGVNLRADPYAGGGASGMVVRWFSDASATVQIGSDISITGPTATSSSADVSSGALVAPVGAIRAQYYPYVVTDGANHGGAFYYVQRRWVNECAGGVTELLQGYVSASTTAFTYTWAGTANASTSTITWTAPTLAVVSGAVKGTTYGRSYSATRRTGAVTMSTLNYMRIVGTAPAFPDGAITIADNGAAVTPESYTYNSISGDFTVLIKRPAGFTAVDVRFTRTGGTVSATDGLFVAVDKIEITDNPYGSQAVQNQNLLVQGSHRTEMSLLVQGLDAAGTTPVPLGNQVIVGTATAGTDGRAKFAAARTLASRAGTSDSTATSGSYDTLGATGSPTEFTFAASKLLPGNYYVMGRIKAPSVVTGDLLSYRAKVTATGADPTFDPITGWKTASVTAVSGSPVWPQVQTGVWTTVPIGMLRLPPADVEDPAATVTIQVAKGTEAVTLDDLFLANADVGQVSIILTGTSGGSYSAVRLDAATVGAPQASCWVGTANGAMVADASRWRGEQHKAEPGLLQIFTVAPGCTTTRVSGTYYEHFHTNVASRT